jgi:carboxymethylenebutenolidase
VLLPDVYYRQGDWAPFDMATAFTDDNERNRLFSFIGSITPDKWASDANAYFDYLESRPEVSGTKFGITGYCMGGRAALTVAGLVPDRVAAAASYHGGGLVTDGADSPHLRADKIQAVVYVGGAENDASFTDDHAEQLEKALTAAGVEHKIEKYAAGHGYAVPDNRSYDADAADRHWTTMREVFGANLG